MSSPSSTMAAESGETMTDGEVAPVETADEQDAAPPRARVRGWLFGIFAVLTLAAIAASTVLIANPVPIHIYLFGFLGAMVYVFTSLAETFDDEGRYGLKIACKAMAAFPLSAGIYLLAFAFPGVGGGEAASDGRAVAGFVFLTGAYVSLTLKALGGLARRAFGVRHDRAGEPARK